MCIIVSSDFFDLIFYFSFPEQNAPNVKNATFANRESELPIIECLMLSSYLVRDTSRVIVSSIAVDFFMAQTPCQIRGLVSTVILWAWGITGVLFVVLKQISTIQWVFYTARCVAVLVFFVIFLLVSKRYKLRKRDDVIPYYMFAEGQFESNNRQESNWLKDHGYFESSASNSERQ